MSLRIRRLSIIIDLFVRFNHHSFVYFLPETELSSEWSIIKGFDFF